MDITNEICDLPAAMNAGEGQEHQYCEQQPVRSSSSSRSGGPSGVDSVLSDRAIRAIFLLLGVGILIPWNAFVSAKPYFTARLCQSGHDVVNFEQWFGLIWNLSSVGSLGLIIMGQSVVEYWKKRNPHTIVDDNQSNSSSSNDSGSTEKKNGSFYNVIVPLGLYTVVFFIQALLVTIPDISPTHFLVVTLIGLGLCGTCGAIATAGIVSTAGLFPSHIGINPFFSGQALGGTAVSVANFVAIAMGEDPSDYIDKHCTPAKNHSYVVDFEADDLISSTAIQRRVDEIFHFTEEPQDCSAYHSLDWAVLSYFLVGCIVLFLCLVGYNKIFQHQNMSYRNDYETVRDHLFDPSNRSDSSQPRTDEVDDHSPRIGLELNDRVCQRQQMQYNDVELPNSSSTRSEQLTMISSYHDQLVTNNYDTGSNSKAHPMSDPETAQMTGSSSNDSCLPKMCGASTDDEGGDENQIQTDIFEDEEDVDTGGSGTTKSILWAIKGPAVCIFLTFTITLAVFPSWISELRSSHECENRFRFDNDLYVPLSFVLFNTGDLLGRLLSGYIPIDRIKHLSQKLVLGAVLRIGFLFVFLICNTTTGKNSKMVVRNDFFSVSIQMLFAVSNGILVSTAFAFSPRLVSSSSMIQERASEIMTFSVFFGLLSGSLLSFPFVQLATQLLG
ncbi:unnamed protein product [Pseudo-nitzschia multistriata]|uniref:Uncharacterized protein n=1 Tax=Pseudo-nitzschia multistriata TaxID=183589 RepID=A0A448ZMY2_9STRA|nr:unnamed protein product [Pseudo-nitzschia multistriata]